MGTITGTKRSLCSGTWVAFRSIQIPGATRYMGHECAGWPKFNGSYISYPRFKKKLLAYTRTHHEMAGGSLVVKSRKEKCVNAEVILTTTNGIYPVQLKHVDILNLPNSIETSQQSGFRHKESNTNFSGMQGKGKHYAFNVQML